MSIRGWKIIVAICAVAILIFAWLFYSVYKENIDMKKAIIIQYATQQEEVLRELERALDNKDNKEEYIKALISADRIIYQNYMITRNYPIDENSSIGVKVNFPVNISIINDPFQSKAVGYSLIEGVMDRENMEWIQALEHYTSNTSKIVDALDYQNKLEGKSLNSQYQVLDEVSEIISTFNLKNADGSLVQ